MGYLSTKFIFNHLLNNFGELPNISALQFHKTGPKTYKFVHSLQNVWRANFSASHIDKLCIPISVQHDVLKFDITNMKIRQKCIKL